MEYNIKKMSRDKDEYIYLNKEVKLYGDQIQSTFDRREIKLLLLFSYDFEDNNFIDRDYLEISKELYNSLKNNNSKDELIDFKFDSINIFRGTLFEDNKIKIIEIYNNSEWIEREKYNLDDLIEYENKKINEDKKNKLCNQFCIYYNQLYNWFKYNNKEKSSNKFSGMMTYMAVKDYLIKNDYIISSPNCFIKNCSQEFDMLILKKGKEYSEDQYIYDKEDVLAVVELKTSGVMHKTNEFSKKIKNGIIQNYIFNIIDDKNKREKLNKIEKNYKEAIKNKSMDKGKLNNEKNEYINDLFNETIKLKNQKDIPPLIYLTLHERGSDYKNKDGNSRINDFENEFNDYNKKKESCFPKMYPIFITMKKDNEKFMMNSKYILLDLLKELK